MSPVIIIMAFTLSAGLVALVRAVLVAPEGDEQESGFVLSAATLKTVKTPEAVALLGSTRVRTHRRIRAA